MILYRYRNCTSMDDNGTFEVVVECGIYDVVKKTPCGYWIETPYERRKRRWVANSGKKRYAYPTKKMAMHNFIARKKRQIKLLELDLDIARQALILASSFKIQQNGKL